MTNRLPIPGGDDGDWGDILNDYLEVSLSSDGTLNPGVVADTQVASGAAINPSKISGVAETQTNKNQASGYAGLNSSGFVPVALLPANIPIANLNVTGTPSSSNYLRGDGTWAIPNSGSSALANDTDVSLSSPANNQVLTYNTSSSKWVNQNAPSASNATTSTPGLVQLSGDLGGTATSPTVAKINGITLPGTTPAAGNVLTASSGTATTWATPAAGVTLDSTASDIAPLGAQAAGSTGKAADAGHVHPTTGLVTTSTTAGGDLSGTMPNPTVAKVNGITLPGSAPASGNVLTATSSTATAWQTPAAGVTLDATVSDIQPDTVTGTAVAGATGKAADAGHQHTLVTHDHTTTNKGGAIPESSVTNLTTDLAATEKTANKGAASGYAPLNSSSQVPVANIPTGSTSSTVAIGNDARFAGSAAGTAGAALSATDATTTNSRAPNGSAGGDLGGTYPNPTVGKLQGAVTLSGTASNGQVLTASSSSAASWTTPTTGAQALVPTAVKTANYTAAAADFVLCDTNSVGAFTVTLPTAPADKTRVAIKLVAVGTTSGQPNALSFVTGGSDKFNTTTGPTSGSLTLLNQAVNLQYISATSVWVVASDDLPMSQTDIRYERSAAAAVATSNIAATYSANSFAPTSATAIDGYTFAANDLILLTGQTSAVQNGLWLVPASGAWTRPSEFASGAIVRGRTVPIMNGTTNINTQWDLNVPTAGITVDTSSQTWKMAFNGTYDAYGSATAISSAGMPGLTTTKSSLGDTGTVLPFTPISGISNSTGANSIEVDSNTEFVSVYVPAAQNEFVGLAHIVYLTQGVRAGSLFGVFRLGTAEGNNQGTIYATISSNGGNTWGTAFQLISDPTYDCRGTGVAQLLDGRIAITYTRNPTSNENTSFPGSTSLIFCPVSSDPAVAGNWTSPVYPFSGLSPSGYDNSVAPMVDLGPQGAQTAGQGTVLQPMQIPNPASTNLAAPCESGYVLGTYSTPGGTITWGSFNLVAYSAGLYYQEPHFTVTQTGRWILTVRNSSSDTCLIYGSDNQGSSWNLLTTLNYIYSSPRIITMTDGTLVILSRISPAQWNYQASNGALCALVYSTAASNGASWSEPKVVDQRYNQGFYDYGGVAQLPSGVLAVFYTVSAANTANPYSELLCRFASKTAGMDPLGGMTARGVKSIDGDISVRGGTFMLNGARLIPQVIDSGPQAWTGTLIGWPEYPRTVIGSSESGGTNFARAIQLPLNVGTNSSSAIITFPPAAGAISAAFTVELRVLKLRSGLQEVLLSKYNTGSSPTSENWLIQFNSSNEASFIARENSSTNVSITGSSALSTGWHWLAMQWDGSSTLAAWVDGASIGTAAMTAMQAPDTVTPLVIGAFESGVATYSNNFVGDLEEIRISTVARYTAGSSYSVPVAPFSLDSNTQLLVHCNEIKLSL